jgi:hypothetical protein
VPSGPLTSLPLHLLVTEKPATAIPQFKDIGSYRNAAWLIKRQAVRVVPALASLKALRQWLGETRVPGPRWGLAIRCSIETDVVNIAASPISLPTALTPHARRNDHNPRSRPATSLVDATTIDDQRRSGYPSRSWKASLPSRESRSNGLSGCSVRRSPRRDRRPALA